MNTQLKLVSSCKSFDGLQQRYAHRSDTLDCDMHFSIFLPPGVDKRVDNRPETQAAPVLYWLSGLTCTDENFVQKAGAQRIAAQLGMVLVVPDTSPRGDGVASDPQGAWDLGLGAGFYINATHAPWSSHYRMHDYVVDELPALVERHFAVSDARAISGHSMGGHGALVAALRRPQRYRSVSAFAPICHPVDCPWGEKAFGAYLGGDRNDWAQWDASLLMAGAQQHLPMLVDQGEADNFLSVQLKPQALALAAQKAAYPLTLRMQRGYDHSYYFIASFIEEHLRFHATYLAV